MEEKPEREGIAKDIKGCKLIDMDKMSSLRHYEGLYRVHPDSQVFLPLAEAYRSQGALSLALKVCMRGVEKYPQLVGGRVSLARIFLDLGRREEAVFELRKALQLEPTHWESCRLLSQTLLQTKNLDLALEALQREIRLSPKDKGRFEDIQLLRQLKEGGESSFSFKDLNEYLKLARSKNKYLFFADRFIYEDSLERAEAFLQAAQKEFGGCPEIQQKKTWIQERKLFFKKTGSKKKSFE